jgi:hypothetical protein
MDIFHPFFERRQGIARHAVGKPGAALIEQDQPGEARQPLEEAGDRRFFPILHLEVRYPPGYHHKIARAIADNLIGDVDVADLRVLRLRSHVPAILHELLVKS